MIPKILIIGACGQIGSELTQKLRNIYGNDNVIASDIREGQTSIIKTGPFEILDATDINALEDVIQYHEITEVYLMAAMLSATSEKFPMKGWHLNMNTLFNVLNLAKDEKIDKIFWPSSIAVFGLSTPKTQTPQHTIMDPNTVYGISKQTGERWCEYYFNRYGVDVRSLRYPGLLSYKTLPGGGTTDYAIEIFHKAINNHYYECFLESQTRLPMMYMEDAIDATIKIMSTASERVKVRSSYNVAAINFTPEELYLSIKKHIPEFTITYKPDFRQAIANTWPSSIDDSQAREDWGWQNSYELEEITELMIEGISPIRAFEFEG